MDKGKHWEDCLNCNLKIFIIGSFAVLSIMKLLHVIPSDMHNPLTLEPSK